ncbi:KH domain protein, archaea, partial [mine drainage metagenome]
ERGHVSLHVDSEGGEVSVIQKDDVLKATLTISVIQAIARGFSPEKAFLLYEEDYSLYIISLREFAKPGSHRISEIKGRLIGRNGRTRQIIEEMTVTHLSIYGDTVSIIGDYISIEYGKEAVMRLIAGSKQRTVYQYLEKQIGNIKLKKFEESFR